MTFQTIANNPHRTPAHISRLATLTKGGTVRVFGEPYDAGNGTVVITVSRRGWGNRPDHPIGIFTVRADSTTWTPAVDSSRVALIGVSTGFVAAAFSTLAMLRRPPWPDMTERVMTALSEARN